MRTTCVGGGPAGLTFAIMAGRAGHEVTVIERQQPSASFGWGVVFWDDLLRDVERHDPRLAASLREHAYTWHDQVVTVGDHAPVSIPSHGYSMRRRQLLELLRDRAEHVGVRIVDDRFTGDPETLDADLVVAADGVSSGVRNRVPEFGTRLRLRRNRYVWFGADREFDSFTFPFVQTSGGWLWAHAYGFEPGMSTFIVETTPETWTALGFDRLDGEDAARRLEEVFAGSLGGARLHPQDSLRHRPPWAQFTEVTNQRWCAGRVALMGDAAHTTHFTIGSGTRLAMEDALCLADSLAGRPTLEAALAAYETERRAALAGAQRAAARSADWYERAPRYLGRTPQEVARLMDDRRSPVMGRLPVG
ncbi:MAG TPA: FAD-dependent monooxygenase, partial [Microlunatus sp.]|nr:FAD-dependent monooxygenase [Microlunatus sp.]